MQAPGTYPNRIREALKQRGYRVQEMADRLGISPRLLTYYMNGELPVRQHYRLALSRRLHCSLQELFPPPTSARQPCLEHMDVFVSQPDQIDVIDIHDR